MKVRLVGSPDSWGIWFPNDPRQIPWHRYLDEVAAAGLEWTELGPPGYLPSDPKTLAGELAERALKVPATFVIGALEDPTSYPQLDDELRRTCDVLAGLGATFLVLIDQNYRDIFTGEFKTGAELDRGAWDRLVSKTNDAGRIVNEEFGLQLTFHPHADTHVELLSQVNSLMADTDPNLVSLCLDFGHFEYKGGDSVELLRKHASRVKYLHLKNVNPTIRTQVQSEDLPFGKAVAMRIFCEPSVGVPDFRRVAKLLESIGYDGWATVEQDIYPCAPDEPLPIVTRSIEYLRAIGIQS